MSNEFFTPQSRNEAILQNICGANNVLPEPQSRIEKLLQAILYEDATIVDFTPESRAELLLYAILTHGEYDAEPQSRNETILQAILTNGEYDALPQSRIEALLIEWLDQTHYEEKTVSGDVVSISDAVDAPVVDLTAAIVPVQDLHGQSSPYPPGGGKNLFDIDGYLTDRGVSYTKSGDTYTITATTSLYTDHYIFSDTDEQVTISFGSFENGTTTNVRIDVMDTNGTIVKSIYPNIGTQTVTAKKIRLNWTDSGNFTISKLQIERGSSATAYAPYSNICPISGWTECKVTRAGKNIGYISDSNIYSQQYNTNTYVDNGVVVTGTGAYSRCGFYIPVVTGETYTVSAKCKRGSNNVQRIGLSDNTSTWGNTYGVLGVLTETLTLYSKTITATSNVLCLEVYPGANGSVITVEDFQVELGSAATAYEPYRGDTYTVTFGSAGTVYGGTPDVTTGTLTVDKAMAIFDGSNDEAWEITYSSKYRAAILISDAVTGGYNWDVTGNYIASSGRAVSYPDAWEAIINSAGKLVIGIPDDLHETATWKSFLAETPLAVVYPLDTPIVYHLSPVEIRTLVGQNTIWADTGSVAVTYKAQRTAAALMMMAGRF